MMKKVAAILVLMLAVETSAAPITYKVEEITRSRQDGDRENEPGLAEPVAHLEIGTAEDTPEREPLPPREQFRSMILIGSEGVTDSATFYGYKKQCEFLCGGELEECHYTAAIQWQDKSIGIPLLALVGVPGKPKQYVNLADTQAADGVPSLEIHEKSVVWPDNARPVSLRIGGERAVFTGKDDAWRFEAPDCRWISYPGTDFSRLACNSAEALFHGETLLLYSMADYNIASARILNRFTVGQNEYFTVMLALKAYNAFGVLTRDENGWKFIVKRANWALLC